MPRLILLGTFPLSSTAKQEPRSGVKLTVLDHCHQWVKDCLRAGNLVVAPAICYYETLRELQRLNATSQIARLRAFYHVSGPQEWRNFEGSVVNPHHSQPLRHQRRRQLKVLACQASLMEL